MAFNLQTIYRGDFMETWLTIRDTMLNHVAVYATPTKPTKLKNLYNAGLAVEGADFVMRRVIQDTFQSMLVAKEAVYRVGEGVYLGPRMQKRSYRTILDTSISYPIELKQK